MENNKTLPAPGNQPDHSILVVGPSWVGDMVMAQSLFKVIKANQPDARIYVLAPAWSEPVLDRMPEVAESIEMPVGHGALQWGMRRKLGSDLKNKNFDQAIVLPGSLKSALVPWFAGISKRTGYVGEQRWGLLNDIRRLDKAVLPLNAERYVALGLGKSEPIPATIPFPDLQINRTERDAALNSFGLSLNKPVTALCPGAEYGPSKRWPAQHFAEVARQKKSEGWYVWIFGSEKDVEVANEINRLSGNGCINLCGKTSLGEVIDLMSCARYVVTNDSGLMHVAAAVGCYVIALYGSSSDAFTPPLTDHCDRLNLNLECSPCFKRECPLGHMNCLNDLVPEMVLDKMIND
jgi:heptosyltransferase-2